MFARCVCVVVAATSDTDDFHVPERSCYQPGSVVVGPESGMYRSAGLTGVDPAAAPERRRTPPAVPAVAGRPRLLPRDARPGAVHQRRRRRRRS